MPNVVLTFLHQAGRSVKNRQGQSLVEYALVLTFVSLLTVVVMSMWGVQMRSLYGGLMTGLDVVRSVL